MQEETEEVKGRSAKYFSRSDGECSWLLERDRADPDVKIRSLDLSPCIYLRDVLN